MGFERISGVITRINQYTDGTSQIGILETSGPRAGVSVCYYDLLDERYLGRNVDFEETTGRDGSISQRVVGVDFTADASASSEFVQGIKKKGRTLSQKFESEDFEHRV